MCVLTQMEQEGHEMEKAPGQFILFLFCDTSTIRELEME